MKNLAPFVSQAAALLIAAGIAGTTSEALAQQMSSPLSAQLGVQLPVAVPTIMMEPFDNAAELLADAQDPQINKALRIGVVRPLANFEAPLGQWVNVPGGGRLWVADIVSPTAESVRVHLSQLNLPAGASLALYDPAQPQIVIGPYEGRGPIEDGQIWAPQTFAERCRIEVYMPAGTEAAGLPVRVGEVLHVYRPWREDPNMVTAAAAGTCHNDVSCYPAWANVAKATARIDYVSGGSGFLCTGQLIKTLANDNTPYFLTANHCISSQTVAQTATIYWFYQKTTCGGSVPAFPSTPTSTVCDYLFGTSSSTSSDHTLLLIKGTLPAGVAWVSWRATATTAGTPLSGVHHPSGDYKRISFGTKSASSPTCSATQHIRADWTPTTGGVTEGGSSGSGIYRNDTQELIGVLTCGPSVCGASTANLNDSYGDFTAAYANATLQNYLAAGSDDAYEPNNTCAQAAALSGTSATVASLVCKSTAEDWYAFTLPAGATLNSSITFTAANGNLGAQLYSTCGGSALVTSAGTTGTQSVSTTNGLGTNATVYMRVYLFNNSTRNTYSLSYTITTPVRPANDNCASATAVGEGTFAFNTTNASTDGPTETLCNYLSNNQVTKDVWFRYTPTATGTATAQTCTGTTFDSKLAAYGSSCPGAATDTAIACQDDNCGTGNNQASISFAVTSGSTYLLRVGGYNNAGGSGSLALSVIAAPTRCSPADIAYGDGEPLPPYGIAGGFNPTGPDGGDFDCFFNAYFAAAPDNVVCDIANGDGEPLPPFGPAGGFNPGVDGGDFDCFFNYYFAGCL